mmetsp:Transcript_48500/g.134457  ORF Transcript_48500/g.134457 Transcript_48500/m.134457 type:complete len:307 (-) Transcript_48500:4529-5449(-)
MPWALNAWEWIRSRDGSCHSLSYAANSTPSAVARIQPRLRTHPPKPLVSVSKMRQHASPRRLWARSYASLQRAGTPAGRTAALAPAVAATAAVGACSTPSCSGCVRRRLASSRSCSAASCSLVTRSNSVVFFWPFQNESSALHTSRCDSGSIVLSFDSHPTHLTTYVRSFPLTLRSTRTICSTSYVCTAGSSVAPDTISSSSFRFLARLRLAARHTSHDQKPLASSTCCTALASAQPLLSIGTDSDSIVGFFRQRASKAICCCDMCSLDAPCCLVSPVKSDSHCADVVRQPPATSTWVRPCQQRYG